MNHARQNTTSHYWSEGSLQTNRAIRSFRLSVLPQRGRTATSKYQMRQSHQDSNCRDSRMDKTMRKGAIMTRIYPYMTLLICLALVACAFVWCVGQASHGAYQDGLRAGKASAQATAQTEAYNQGYERGYANAMYEVSA